MKKFIIILAYTFFLSALFACSATTQTENAPPTNDEAFLSSIEESVLDRMAATASEKSDLTIIINKELAYLQEYRSATFSDEQLSNIAKKYLDGLDLQKQSLTEAYEWESQIEWQEGLVYRLEALKALYEDYDFLADNKDFIASYILSYDHESALLRAYNTLEDDIGQQLSSDSLKCYWSNYDCCFDLWNNTAYQFSSVFEIKIFDQKGNLISQDEYYVENIRPDTGYTISITLEKPWDAASWEINNYYTDVIC